MNSLPGIIAIVRPLLAVFSSSRPTVGIRRGVGDNNSFAGKTRQINQSLLGGG
ncbi:MAG: hypothetical protein IMZ73_07755 [Chloroflexi bacterium]|nr:hypothetical protein [Chloroflexota bacterium]